MGFLERFRRKRHDTRASEASNVGLTSAAFKIAVLLCKNSMPCDKHRDEAIEFCNIFSSHLPWCESEGAKRIWEEIDGFCAAKANGDQIEAIPRITAINNIIQGIAAAAWHAGNQAGKRVASSISVVDLDKPLKG